MSSPPVGPSSPHGPSQDRELEKANALLWYLYNEGFFVWPFRKGKIYVQPDFLTPHDRKLLEVYSFEICVFILRKVNTDSRVEKWMRESHATITHAENLKRT